MSAILIENIFGLKFLTTPKTVMGDIVHLPSHQNYLFIEKCIFSNIKIVSYILTYFLEYNSVYN